MPAVVGIRFKPVTKIYYFLPPEDTELQTGDPVVVETSRGKELGWVAMATKPVADSEVKGQLKKVLRRATPIDLMKRNDYEQRKVAALEKCREKVAELELPMKVVEAEYSFDGSRLLFSFSAEQRVDFRDLVRALVRSLRTRVEMRQIGARDEAKIIDGYGRCGRQLCCSSWLTEFHPVSIRMAKNQQLPLAPTEISGVCGRLLCCLAYEDAMYTELKKSLPAVGSEVQTEEGTGTIRGLNILKQTAIVELEETNTRVELSVEAITLTGGPKPKKSRAQPPSESSSGQPSEANSSEAKSSKLSKKNSSSRSRSKSRRRRKSRGRKRKNQPKDK